MGNKFYNLLMQKYTFSIYLPIIKMYGKMELHRVLYKIKKGICNNKYPIANVAGTTDAN